MSDGNAGNGLTAGDKWRIGLTISTWILGLALGFWIDDRLDKMTALMEATRDVAIEVRTVVEMGPEALAQAGEGVAAAAVEAAGGLSDGARETGEGVGDGAATAIDRAGAAWNAFKARDQD